jgi:hypothetical protein
MDSLRTRVVLAPTETATRATVSRALARRLLEATHDRSTSDAGPGEGLSQLALCIEFEKTVEDAALWQSSFGNGRVADSVDAVGGGKVREKDVLLIWVELSAEVSRY